MRVQSHTLRLALSTVTVFGLLQGVISAHEPEINVALKTSFSSAPYLVELLETAALENETSYFPLLDRIAAGTFAELRTEEELYNKFINILEEDGHFQSAETLSSFKFALSLHAAAPRIEAQFQYYKTSVEPRMMAAQDAVCPVWVHFDGQQYCSPALERAQQPVEDSDFDVELPFDRILGTATNGVPSILYADISHPLFGEFHQTVSQTAKEGKSSYRVRYRPASGMEEKSLYVSGYGVELTLKRTDYIVIDDRAASDVEKEKQEEDDKVGESNELKPLTTSELASLGLNTASHIMSSEKPFEKLLEISANFPKYSSIIATEKISADFLGEHRSNRELLLPAGYNVIWMNGLQIQNRDMNAYSLIEILRRERQLISRLKDIGLTATEAVDLLSHEVLAQAQADDKAPRYDWQAGENGKSVIMWLNDIEKDSRYANWPPGLGMLLQRTYPGQIPQVRRDIHNLVVPVDLNNIEDLDLIVNTLQMLIKRTFPIRVGLVPAGTSSDSKEAATLSYYIFDTFGLSTLMKFYQEIVVSKKGIAAVEKSFVAATKEKEPRAEKKVLEFEDIYASERYLRQSEAAEEYRNRLALNEKTPPLLLNGVAIPRSENWFDAMSQRVYADHRMLQAAVYEERISDDIWAPQYFLDTAASRRNALIIPENLKDVEILNVGEISSEFATSFSTLPRVQGADAALLSERAHLILVADLNNADGQRLLSETMIFHKTHPEAELMLLHNPQPGEALSGVSTKLFGSVTDRDRDISGEALQEILESEKGKVHTYNSLDEKASDYWMSHEPLVERLGLGAGESALLLNGRMVGPIKELLLAADLETLLSFERSNRIAPVTTAITALALDDKFHKPLDLAKITSIIARSLKSDIPEGIYESAPLIRLGLMKKWKGEHSMIHLKSASEPTIQLVASLDPASEVTQSWISLLNILSELDGVDVKVYLNPREKLTELPIKRFYRNVISSTPSFHQNGTLVTPQATFSGIPKDTLFNLGMVVPPAWLVSPEESIYDLDNIKLSSVPTGQDVNALYEMEHILIEGHSRDVTKGPPPRGVQLLLGSEQNPHFTDTIIMANLGYFQFKANPGHWRISLKPGRSSKIFNIDSVGSKGYAAQHGDEGSEVTLMSFQGATLFPRLSRKTGMEDEDVLETTGLADAANTYLKNAQSILSSLGLGSKSKHTSTNADINIFSVASGHLYERMLNIMMLSVMKHTKHTVKFWFIEQFLSPSFKVSLPYLAKHYGFSYEMVTYKWPHWLRGQKEKQREIWGYKILFLDVLFPVDLDKVIFVDADQIVRTDMMELNKIDLHGAPYGFTPMCDSRTEMEGFRFWKQGYWANFLDGKPYHISALYVVDLKRFRELAAGDRLRGQYHALSADPNSLSNLDQDLPNHMQHSLPIYSLPQEWLWCETWCSDETFKDAKTIDLCNNPQTKEPKLDRARRQVPEWTVYDNEIADVLKSVIPKGDIENGGEAPPMVQEEETHQRPIEKKGKDEL